jgi:hypothetical protein
MPEDAVPAKPHPTHAAGHCSASCTTHYVSGMSEWSLPLKANCQPQLTQGSKAFVEDPHPLFALSPGGRTVLYMCICSIHKCQIITSGGTMSCHMLAHLHTYDTRIAIFPLITRGLRDPVSSRLPLRTNDNVTDPSYHKNTACLVSLRLPLRGSGIVTEGGKVRASQMQQRSTLALSIALEKSGGGGCGDTVIVKTV